MIFNRYQLITFVIQSNALNESDRPFIAKLSDDKLFNVYGKQQFRELRKGYYTLN